MADPHLATPAGRRRARALGIPFEGVPGRLNAITDVPGIEVGYRTLVSGEGPLVVGRGPVRTGVTAIHPRGRDGAGIPVFAGVHSLNGAGEMTGFAWIEEAGRTELPLAITNTHSAGLARDALAKWMVARHPGRMDRWVLPVAAETYDGHLSDINGFHVRDEDVFAALDGAAGGPVEEGSVGGGTGMICYEFKGGSGTASRLLRLGGRDFHLGVFVQANFGRREQLAIAGLPVGRWLAEGAPGLPDHGSIIAVVATDLPLMPHQLKRLARRAGMGIARSGSIAAHGSGDIFLAFSTANAGFFAAKDEMRALEAWPDEGLNPAFAAVIQCVDEAVLNAMVANEAMTGRDGHHVPALPHAPVEAWCRRLRAGPPPA
jgi:L-aminopeptidase/D-esterase-like protein